MKRRFSLLRFAQAALLMILISTQSACVLLKPFGLFQNESLVGAEPQMMSFRYDIPRPAYKTAAQTVAKKVVQTKKPSASIIRFKSFIEEMMPFSTRKSSKSKAVQTKASQKPQVVAKRTPVSKRPPRMLRSQAQNQFCKQVNKRLSSISQQDCLSISLTPTGHSSVLGQPILLSQFGHKSGVQPTGRVLLLGGVHGDELSAVSLVFEWMQFLRGQHGDEFIWHVIPVMNPDGFFKAKPTRINAHGVDLNRNMPTKDWQGEALTYWRDRAKSAPRKFPGFSSASEPETRWLVEEINRFQPDMIISVHAPHNLIDYDAPSRKNAPRRFGKLKGGLLGTFPGSLGNYAGVKRGIPVVTIELPSANIATPVEQAHDMWADMIVWLSKTIPLENQRFMDNRRFATR